MGRARSREGISDGGLNGGLQKAVAVICDAVATQSDLIQALSRRIANLNTTLGQLSEAAKAEGDGEDDLWKMLERIDRTTTDLERAWRQ